MNGDIFSKLLMEDYNEMPKMQRTDVFGKIL